VVDVQFGTELVELVLACRGTLSQAKEAIRELLAVARREEALLRGYGHARSPQIAQRVAITGSQVSIVVLREPH
jgi:hypothetical protein